jgi:mycofactocin precursor
MREGADMANPTEIAQVVDPTAPALIDDVDVVVEELLVEEVSIDGMCGVY